MNIPAGLRPHFKAIAYLGMLALIGDAWLSIKFGYSIAAEMAIIAGVISVASGLMLVAAMFFDRIGWKWLGRGLAALWVPVFLFNCWSNMGVSTANRMGEVQTARVQQTNYTERKKSVEDAERSLKFFEAQLATLLEQKPWVGTVTADGLRTKAETLQNAIVEEGSPKNGGCKRKCLALMAEKAKVDEQIAGAEQRLGLEEQIAATKRVIAANRETLASTDKGISSTANQSTLYAKLISFNLASDPDADMVTVANESTGIGFAVILALIATALTIAGAWPHILAVDMRQVLTPEPPAPEAVGEPVRQSQATHHEQTRAYPLPPGVPSGIPSEPLVVHTVETIKDETLRKWALSDEVRAMLQPPRAAAA